MGPYDGRFEFSVFPEGNLYYIQTDNEDLKPTKGEWYQIAGVYNGSETTLYTNGQIQPDKKDISGKLRKYNTSLRIGSADGSRKLIGILDEGQIYNRAFPVQRSNRLATEGFARDSICTHCTF